MGNFGVLSYGLAQAIKKADSQIMPALALLRWSYGESNPGPLECHSEIPNIDLVNSIP